ncbi:MAG: universal stress protein, partial [Thaumarchaeota archaeon]|nr:universal stress protein [Nitrososphaerota archaeon]
AVDVAIQVAKAFDSELIIISVVDERYPAIYTPVGVGAPALDYSQFIGAAERDAKQIVDEAVQKAKKESANASGEAMRTVSSVVECIIDKADNEAADLIIMGTRGLGGFKRLLLGSVSSGVVSHANCAVLVVR